MSNIRDKEAYINSLWDWSFLNDCFGATRIRVSDIDGAVERKGHLLFIETKLPGQEIPTGQALMFQALRDKGATVLVIWGHANRPEYARCWPHDAMPATTESIRQFVRDWFRWADQGFVPRG